MADDEMVAWLTDVLTEEHERWSNPWEAPDSQRRSGLARVEAERAVMALHGPEERGRVTGPGVTEIRDVCNECTEWGANDSVAYPCLTIRLLAHGHRFDAPNYRNEWSPQ